MLLHHVTNAARTAAVAVAIVGVSALGVAGIASATPTGEGTVTAPSGDVRPLARIAEQAPWVFHTVSGTAISGGSAVDTVSEDELIIGADGTGYSTYSDYVSGSNAYEELPYGYGYGYGNGY